MNNNLAMSTACMLSIALLAACGESTPTATPNPHVPEPYVKLTHPAWSKNATVYQLNTRQFFLHVLFNRVPNDFPRVKIHHSA